MSHTSETKTETETRTRRNPKRKWAAALAALAAATLGLGGCHARALIDGLPRDAEAPDLGVETWVNADGKQVELAQLRGKPVVLEFWSTRCPPCVRNLPKIQRIARGYGEQVHVVTVHVSLDKDRPGQDGKAIREYLRNAGVDYPVGIDSEGKLWKRFDFHYLPHMVLIDADGKVRWSGNLLVHDAEAKVQRAFGAPPRAAEANADRAPAAVMAPVTSSCEGGVCAPR